MNRVWHNHERVEAGIANGSPIYFRPFIHCVEADVLHRLQRFQVLALDEFLILLGGDDVILDPLLKLFAWILLVHTESSF